MVYNKSCSYKNTTHETDTVDYIEICVVPTRFFFFKVHIFDGTSNILERVLILCRNNIIENSYYMLLWNGKISVQLIIPADPDIIKINAF